MRTVELTYRYGSPNAALRPRPADPAPARLRLSEGNRAFASLLDAFEGEGGAARRIVEVDPRDLGLEHGERHAPRQHPFAAILGCSDARAPIELIFNEGPNELFVVRVAGNGPGADALGSLSYAVERLSETIRLIVVLGHSGCGALTAAVDAFLEPSGYFAMATNFALRGIVDRCLSVVDASARQLATAYGAEVTNHPRYREALIESSIAANAALTAYAVQQEFRHFDKQRLRAAYGIYLLETREVWAPPATPDKTLRLAEPPDDVPGLAALGERVVRSSRIAALLA